MEDYIKFAKKYLLTFCIIFAASSFLAIRCRWWFLLIAAVPSGLGVWLCTRVITGKQRVYIEKNPKTGKKPDKGKELGPVTAYEIFCLIDTALMIISFVLMLVFYQPETFDLYVWSFGVCLVTTVIFAFIIIHDLSKEPWGPWFPWYM